MHPQFECGNYSAASEFLYHYRTLSTDSERNLSALWGKLAAEILMQVTIKGSKRCTNCCGSPPTWDSAGGTACCSRDTHLKSHA